MTETKIWWKLLDLHGFKVLFCIICPSVNTNPPSFSHYKEPKIPPSIYAGLPLSMLVSLAFTSRIWRDFIWVSPSSTVSLEFFWVEGKQYSTAMAKQEQCRIRSQRHVRIRTSKKTKEKKPAQRGRGIPELERMILKEQQKEIAAAALTPSILFPLPFPANLPLPTANFNPLTPISSVHLFGFHPFPMPPDPPYSQGGSSGRNWMDFVNNDGAEQGSQQKPCSMVTENLNWIGWVFFFIFLVFWLLFLG